MLGKGECTCSLMDYFFYPLMVVHLSGIDLVL